jgi:deferrochelatase/peroxidase EfeB
MPSEAHRRVASTAKSEFAVLDWAHCFPNEGLGAGRWQQPRPGALAGHDRLDECRVALAGDVAHQGAERVLAMVTWMVLWMRQHSKDLRKELARAAGGALEQGTSFALVAIAFLAVVRESVETAVFLVAASQTSAGGVTFGGAALGVAVALVLGYLIYRGGVKVNLSRFFRITGVVLVLVAGGVLSLHHAYEAGWITVGNEVWLDLFAVLAPSSVPESLLANKMPKALAPFGRVPGEGDMKPDISGGDICVQACADDPQVVFHAIRNLTRIARGTAVLRWSQLGFVRASATGTGQRTPRNLFGFKDGTRNIHAEETADLDADVWVGQETEQQWMRGGSFLVARKIAMIIESWDATELAEQERIFGRRKASGAPLSGGDEFARPDFEAKAAVAGRGERSATTVPVIDARAHVRLAAPEQNNGVRILRRGYNYTDGQDVTTGRLDAGLFFIAFQKDVGQFRALQTKLGTSDLLNEYITHIGGGTWACPPGVSKAGDWFGTALFA